MLLPCRASLDCIRTDTLVRLGKPDARRRRVGTLSFAIDMHARVKSLSDDTLGSISGGQLIMQLFESSKSIGGTSYILPPSLVSFVLLDHHFTTTTNTITTPCQQASIREYGLVYGLLPIPELARSINFPSSISHQPDVQKTALHSTFLAYPGP